ncbi:MAG: hypothetical protein QXN15_06895 [Candidatus Jordarchaeales archaeon]
MIIEAVIILAVLLLLLLCLLGGRLHLVLLYLALSLRFTSSVLSVASRHWRLIAATLASLIAASILLVVYGFGLEVLPPLSPLTLLLVCASWLLHSSSTAFVFAGAVCLLHGTLHPFFIMSSSLFVGVAVWMLLHGNQRLAGTSALSSLILSVVPYAASRVTAPSPSPPATLPLAVLAVVICSAVALSSVFIARVLFERRAVCESFYASYVSSLTGGGKVAGGVTENGVVRVVMLALTDGDKVHVLVSGCFREEFEDRSRLLGGMEDARTIVSREVKKAWRRYLFKGDPQPAVNLLLKLLEAGERGEERG